MCCYNFDFADNVWLCQDDILGSNHINIFIVNSFNQLRIVKWVDTLRNEDEAYIRISPDMHDDRTHDILIFR